MLDCIIYNIENNDFILQGELSLKEILLKDDLGINLQLKNEDISILKKIKDNSLLINDICKVSQGLIPYDKYRGHTEEQIKNRVFHSDKFSIEFSKKELRGEDVSRYILSPNNNLYINYGKHLAAPREQDFFIKPRILIREITRGNYYKIFSSYIEGEFYNTPVMINIISNNNLFNLKYILSLLNSKLYTYYHLKTHSKALAETSIPKILVGEVRNIPIKNISLSEQTPFIEKADFMLENNKILQEKINKFLSRLNSSFEIDKMTNKLKEFYLLEFGEFVKELKKKKIEISLKDQDEWEEYFDSYKKEILELKSQIDKCDKEIDEMVFDLYGLDESERGVVLNCN